MKPLRRACLGCALLLALVGAGSGKQTPLERIIAPGESPKKLADGFTFTEGPTWLKGKLYFSDMWFKNPAGGDWTGSPARSRLIVMEPDGRHRVLADGMQSNGTIVGRTGNLIVCDMFGHRVVELDPANGRVAPRAARHGSTAARSTVPTIS